MQVQIKFFINEFNGSIKNKYSIIFLYDIFILCNTYSLKS
jgi:hypothetical protein